MHEESVSFRKTFSPKVSFAYIARKIVFANCIMDYSVGIDLGTTNSCVGLYKGGNKVDIIANEHGYRTTPSFVSFTDEERFVGKTAKDNVGRNPKNTVYDVKRLMGKSFSDPSIQSNLKYLSFDVEPDEKDRPVVKVEWMDEEQSFLPEQISGMILEKMKKIAENYVQDKIVGAVITVPAYFSNEQRKATKTAGEIAGLTVLRIINEPTAAAIAYGLDKEDEKNVLVYDLGGGTLDVTVLNMQSGVLNVKSTSGNPHLGGEDFDNELRDYCVLKFSDKYIMKNKLDIEQVKKVLDVLSLDNRKQLFDLKPEVLEGKMSLVKEPSRKKYLKDVLKVLELQSNVKKMRKLKSLCEDAKKALSTSNNFTIELDEFYNGKDLKVKISKNTFEKVCKNKFELCMEPVDRALEDAGFTHDNIDDVVFVGGSTRMPKIHQMINEKFPDKIHADINPDEAVAYGASIQAAIINKQFQSESGGSIVMRDVTPLSLGIETQGGVMKNMIDRNTHIPTDDVVKVFTTSIDNQPKVTVKVYEGERKMTKHNNELGKFDLQIPPMKKGKPKIIV